MNFFNKLQGALYQTDGPLTQSIAKSPGPESLGLLPNSVDQTTQLVCGFCSTGCNLEVHQKGDQAINLSPEKTHPVNLGKACPKGWQALAPIQADDRATTPLVKTHDGTSEAVSWDRALDLFQEKLEDTQKKQGPQGAAFLSTGQITTEEMALLGSLAKFGLGFKEGDGNTRQCMATSASAYKQSFGFDAPPFSYADLKESDVLVFIGANPCINHPILWKQVVQNPHQPKILVLDPRFTKTAQAATTHYALKPKSDLILLYGLAKILIEKHWIDADYIEQHTQGFTEFSEFVCALDLGQVSAESGLSLPQLSDLAQTLATGKRVSFWWTMGINQGHQAVLSAQAIINLALMTGNMGRPGTGANSITGQCNAMGSRLFSNTTNLLGGHDFGDRADREKVAQILGIEPKLIPQAASLPYEKILDEIEAGRITFLWVIATNPAHSWIEPGKWERICEKLDFLVVQDLYADTLTATSADLFLPAAGWGEKEGVMINSERRISKVNPVQAAPGLAKTDFEIFLQIAKRFGLSWVETAFSNPAQGFETLKKLSAGQPCDFSGISGYPALQKAGGIQWPEAGSGPGTKRLFAEGTYYTQSQKANFCFGATEPPPFQVNPSFPYVLLTGRGSSTQWHTGTRTDRSAILKKMSPKEIYVEISPALALELEIKEGETVNVLSQRSSIRAKALVTTQVKGLEIFIPMHYPAVNLLLEPVFDPISHQPSYKHTPVNVTKL